MGQLSPTNLMSGAWLPTYEDNVIKPVAYAEIYSAFNYVSGSGSLLLGSIPVVSGSVTIDRNNVIRRTASGLTLTLDAAGLLLPVANANNGLFSPYGNELRLYKGVSETTVTPGSQATGFATSPPPVLPVTIIKGVNDTFVWHSPIIGAKPTVYYLPPGTYAALADLSGAFDSALDIDGVVIPDFFSDDGTFIYAISAYDGSFFDATYLTSGPTDALAVGGFASPTNYSGGADDTISITDEYAQLGVYCIGEVVVNDDGTGVTLIGTLNDRAQWISRRGFAIPFSISGAVFGPIGDFIQALLGAAQIGNAAFTYAGAAWSTGSNPCPYIPGTYSYTVGDDPWQAMCDVAAAAGLELYFDYEGNLVLDYVPDPALTTPCVSYLEGSSTAPVSIARDLSNVTVPNVICVMSQGSSVTAPVMVWWWDSNPSSETYFAPGPIGGFLPTNPQYTLPGQDPAATYPQMIQEFDSNLIGPTFQAEQAQALAIAIGLTSIGSIEEGTFTIRDQPAHDVDDVITFQRVVAGIPASTNYVVDQVQIDLTPQTAESLATRLIAA